MKLLSIGAMGDLEEIKNKIQQEIFEDSEGVRKVYLKIEEEKIGTITFLHFCIEDLSFTIPDQFYFIQNIKNKIYHIIADFIIHFGKFRYMYQYIEKKYAILTAKEKDAVYTRIIKYFIHHSLEKKDEVLKNEFKQKILDRVIEAFQENPVLIIEGFIHFRLREYVIRVRQIVDYIVSEYLTEMEYNEFIQLLKYFVSTQESLLEVMHVIPKDLKKYVILNEKEEDITSICIEEFEKDVHSEVINYDDLLISTLISMAPNKVIVHNPKGFKNEEILQTILLVFKEKVELYEENKEVTHVSLDIH